MDLWPINSSTRGLFVVVHENREGGGVRCDGEISYK